MNISKVIETVKYYWYSGVARLNIMQFFLLSKKWSIFWKDFEEYILMSGDNKKEALRELSPALYDNTIETKLDPIYFYQDCWAFEKIIQNNPESHFDIGSHHKFVALLSKVINVTMIDIRPLSLHLESLKFIAGNIIDLPFKDGSIQSLSSLCVVEHIGLGRYGDSIDSNGTEKAAKELQRVISKGGFLYISVPISSKNILRFNSHRVFNEQYLLGLFSEMECVEQKYIVGETISDEPIDKECVGLYKFQRK